MNILALDNFMGFVNKKSTCEQIKEVLTTNGISFRESPDMFDNNKKQITFSYEAFNVIWSCHLSLQNDVLRFVSLNNYSPDSYRTFKTICDELSKRYGPYFNIRQSKDKREGTETLCFEYKDDPWRFTEVVYDSSPILGQKNIYIKYF